MARNKIKRLTDEEFISSVLPGLQKKNGHWYLYREIETGRGVQFEDDALRLIDMCIARGGKAKFLERHGWWLYYKHHDFAAKDKYLNYCIFDMDGAFARHLETLIARRGH